MAGKPVIIKLLKPKRNECRWCGASFIAYYEPHYSCSVVCRQAYKNERRARFAKERGMGIREAIKLYSIERKREESKQTS